MTNFALTAVDAASSLISGLISSGDTEPGYLVIARQELARGVKEKPGRAHNARIIEYHAHTQLHASDDETPWCSSFVNFCVDMAGGTGTNNAMARSWLRWGVSCEPCVGAIVVLRRGKPPSGHVGILVRWTDTYVWLLAGNQSNEVNITRFRRSEVLPEGFRWPKGLRHSTTTIAAGAGAAGTAAKAGHDVYEVLTDSDDSGSLTGTVIREAIENGPTVVDALKNARETGKQKTFTEIGAAPPPPITKKQIYLGVSITLGVIVLVLLGVVIWKGVLRTRQGH